MSLAVAGGSALAAVVMLLTACSGSLDPIAASHIEANVPLPGDFHPMLKRDVTADLSARAAGPVDVEYSLLRSSPTQSGTSFPKYYAWVRAYNRKGTVIEGAVRMSAVQKKRFEITAFVARRDIVDSPSALASFFPEELIADIRARAAQHE